jgi:hypothetical protein
VTGGYETLLPGQVSPDGWWRWDGQQWVLAASAAPQSPPPPPSRAWIAWLVGGCAVLLLMGAVPIGFAVYGAVKSLQGHGMNAFTCLPPDFPAYPGTFISGESTHFGTNVAPGDSVSCQVTFQSNDNISTVTSFYVRQLDTGDWTIASSDPATGEIRIRRKSRPATVGTVNLIGRGQHSEIQIRIDS